MDEDIDAEEKRNKEKKHRIEMLEQEHKDLSDKLERSRRKGNTETLKHQKSIHESTNEIGVLEKESSPLDEELNGLFRENKEKDRLISKQDMIPEFKADDELIEKEKLARENKIIGFDKTILTTLGDKAVAQRKLDDPNLIDKEKTVAMELQGESSKIEINKSVAESKIKELEEMRKMGIGHWKKKIAENRKLEQELKALEKENTKSSGKTTDPAFKEFLGEMEARRAQEMEGEKNFMLSHIDMLSKVLAEEEKKASDELEKKQQTERAQQKLDIELAEVMEIHAEKRQELLEAKNERDRLEKLKIAQEEEKAELEEECKKYDVNDKTKGDIEELKKQINLTMKRIRINNLLNEIDIEEVIQATNNNLSLIHI